MHCQTPVPYMLYYHHLSSFNIYPITCNFSFFFFVTTYSCGGAGTFWTATLHIITMVIGSGVLSLAWDMGQLGWVAGPYCYGPLCLCHLYTSNLLSQSCRSRDPVTGHRNYTYIDAVKANLGIYLLNCVIFNFMLI